MAQRRQFLDELGYQQVQAMRRTKLTEMIQKSDRFNIIDRLQKEGVM